MSSKAKKDKHVTDILGDASRLVGQASLIIRLAYRWERSSHNGRHLKSIAIYPPSTSRNGMWLVIGKGWYGDQKVVAFHRSTDILSALAGFLQRVAEEKIEWKEDTWNERWDGGR